MSELKLQAKVGADISEFMAGMKRVQNQAGVLQTAFNKIRGSIGGIAAALGAYKIAAWATDAVQSSGKLQDAAERLTVSAGLLEQVTAESKKSGGSLESVVSAFEKLTVARAKFAAGDEEVSTAFKELAIDAEAGHCLTSRGISPALL